MKRKEYIELSNNSDENLRRAGAAFHRHLDGCESCRSSMGSFCNVGRKLYEAINQPSPLAPLTDEEICWRCARVEGGMRTVGVRTPGFYQALPDYLHSLDALRPALERLTLEQKRRLNRMIDAKWYLAPEDQIWNVFALLLPPADLARMVAEVIGEDAQ